ncbi:poly-gamma-glutamate biosynthesis protein, partial [bacterium (Candidatus Gribaldobacteria) CG_4_10_14_0_2_um_filter_36_18]
KPEAVDGLVYGGFDILSLANNHMLDYQRIALEDTMNILKENKIDYVGAGFNKEEAFSLKIKEIKNTRIGFLAYTNLGPGNWKAGEKNSGMAWISENDIGEIAEDIKKSKKEVDILIISLHAGEEYEENPTSFQTSFAMNCIENGADLVVGHHSHVVQKIERYNDGWIAYSLGNFIFDQGFSEETMKSIILKVAIKDKKIKEISSEDIKINKYFQPDFDN